MRRCNNDSHITSHTAAMERVVNIPLAISFKSLLGRLRSHEKYFISTMANNPTVPMMNGIQKLAKKVILEISKFTFNQHHHTSRVYSARAQQTALAAEHTFVHLLVCSLILSASHQRMHLAEVELRKVSSCAGRRAGSATDAGLQLGHLVHNLVALAQVVAVDVDGAGFAD